MKRNTGKERKIFDKLKKMGVVSGDYMEPEFGANIKDHSESIRLTMKKYGYEDCDQVQKSNDQYRQ